MPEIDVTIVLPNGGARKAEIPDDVIIRDLLAEMTSLLGLPTVGPDGRPMGYRLDSKALGRELQEHETLADAGVPADDRLVLTADITAGAGKISLDQSPRMRRLKADHKRMLDLAAQSDLIEFKTVSTIKGMAPERYIVTYKCKGIVGVDKNGKPKIGQQTPGGDLPAQSISPALAGHAVADPCLASQHQPS